MQESAELAAKLLQRSVIAEQCLGAPPVLRSDNGAPMQSLTLLSKMHDLGISPSRGRPRVRNDNPYPQPLFRTLKYCPQWPQDGFADLAAARAWLRDFMHRYNHEHRHSRIRLVTPAERRRGVDRPLLARRHALDQQARALHPGHCSGQARNREPTGALMRNPDRQQSQQKAAA